MPEKQPTPSRFAVEVDDEICPHVRSCTLPAAQKVRTAPGAEVARLEVALGPGKKLNQWLQAFFGRPSVKDVTIYSCDASHRPFQETVLAGCAITEVQLPTLDVASRSPAFMSLTIEAGTVTSRQPDAAAIANVTRHKDAKGPRVAGFQLRMDGMPPGRVTKIEGLTATCPVTRRVAGAERTPVLQPGRVETGSPKVTVSVDPGDAQAWLAWSQALLGGRGASVAAQIDLLGSDNKKVAELALRGCGLRSFNRARSAPGPGAGVVFELELTTEDWDLKFL